MTLPSDDAEDLLYPCLSGQDLELLFGLLGSVDDLLGALVSQGRLTMEQASDFSTSYESIYATLSEQLEDDVYPYTSIDSLAEEMYPGLDSEGNSTEEPDAVSPDGPSPSMQELLGVNDV